MKWNEFKDHPPAIGMWIACYRKRFPSYFWMGQYIDLSEFEEEEAFDFWIEIPKMERWDD